MNRQQHPDQLRQQARELYPQHGAPGTAQRLGIPARSVRRWARLERWPRKPATGHARDQQLRLVDAHAQPAPVKNPPPGRPRLAMRIREELWAQLDQLKAYREGKRARDAKDTAVVCGVLLDKLLLLEQRDPAAGQDQDPAVQVARLVELVDVVTEREAADG